MKAKYHLTRSIDEKILGGFLSLIIALNAAAQVESGTLIVLNASQDEIAVAADSRSYSAAGQFDDRCKITTLGDKFIFAASGNTAYGPNGGRPYWDVHAIAKNIFADLSNEATIKSVPIDLATKWGREVKRQIEIYLKRDGPSGILEGTENSTVTSAVIAGFVDDHPLIVTVSVNYQTVGDGQISINWSIRNIFEKPNAVMLGRENIANELFSGQTQRAIEWREALKTHTGDPMATPAIEAIRFSIANYPLVSIHGQMRPPLGGPIDALRIARHGGIEWIQRKAECK
jgi:hypothetical protein